MNSLASPLNQGQGQVTPAGSYLITGIWSRSQKTPFTRSIGKMMFETSFTKLHSQKKEMQLSNFLKGWNSVNSHVLKCLSISIVKEPGNILEQGFLHIVTKSIGKMKYSTKFICLHSSPKYMPLCTVRFFWACWDWVYMIATPRQFEIYTCTSI